MDPLTVGVMTAQQPHNLYAGGSGLAHVPEPLDTEQYWARFIGARMVERLNAYGHRATLFPMGTSFRDNVRYANANRHDRLISCHTNATATLGDKPRGIGFYHHPNSPEGRRMAEAMARRSTGFPGGSYVRTLTVAELASTFDPAVLGEFQFHDWVGDVNTGGAAYIRDGGRRDAMVEAAVLGFCDLYGGAPPAPAPEVPVVVDPLVKPTPPTVPAFPLGRCRAHGRQMYYGPRSGPDHSVSGYYGGRDGLRQWQTRMLARGWTSIGKADGLWGPRTERAARLFQVEKGLPVDGLVGPATWRAAWTTSVTPY